MCGVILRLGLTLDTCKDLLIASLDARYSGHLLPGVQEKLQARGPTAIGWRQVGLPFVAQDLFAASLLQVRGAEPISSSSLPLADKAGSVLLFNGELFGGLNVAAGCNDGQALLHELCHSDDPAHMLSRLLGPWALVYWHAASRRLWFGRDALGRRSLLIQRPSEQRRQLTLSSFALCTDPQAGWQELKPGVYSIAYARASNLLDPGADSCLGDAASAAAAEQVFRALEHAVRTMCEQIDPLHWGRHMSDPADVTALAAPVLILFSGGVDSTLLAALAHRVLPGHLPIDLACVCFDGGQSPDRLAALDAVQELSAYAPSRLWRLVEVDATLADVATLQPRLLGLLHPADTVMDINIGAALWLAARAEGRLCFAQERTRRHRGERSGGAWRSSAKVVLLGQGADEQCAGYGRHRTKFREGGWEGLHREMALDVGRLWLRNLGRDDRIVSDHGREARHPFLDEALLQLLLSLPLPLIADLTLAPGVGDKLVLRNLLRLLGLPRAAARVKRAIQFGTRLGKLANRRDFGSNRAANISHAGSVKLAQLGLSGDS
ncbi:hypothetical protein WJX73_010668 [Symbiochloris irregularis]|uniref:Glutamine amidotransferase type-2 domain-containing protein n=1 Tax=Symbiochloris irregularis TaxID=706552 RepID=A0AAW1NN39_9CHLO